MDRRTRKRLAAKAEATRHRLRATEANSAQRDRRRLTVSGDAGERRAALEKLTNWQRSRFVNRSLGSDDPRDYLALKHWKRAAA